MPGGAVGSAPAWATFYAGLTLDGYPIPQKGLRNNTLYRTLGIVTEPLGNIIQYRDRDFVKGKVLILVVPGTVIWPMMRLSPYRELARELPEDDYYVAMRWDYKNRKRFWCQRHLLVATRPMIRR